MVTTRADTLGGSLTGSSVKFRVPAARGAVVSRQHLIEKLAAGVQPLVIVIGPAGYGKTTLLAAWAGTEARDTAWISLDESDDDPVALATSILSALGRAGLAPELPSDEIGAASGPAGRSLAELVGPMLDQASRPFVLMLDDVHHVVGPSGLSLLEDLVGYIPEGSQLVLSGRTEPAFVARRRVEGSTIEIGTNDLALDQQGVSEVFAAAHVTIPPDVAHTVVTRTEGWPAGVYLAALMAEEESGSWSSALPITGSSRVVADYLLRHSFERLPDETQEFLISASVLDTMSASLCDHMLDAVDSQRMLYRLEQGHLFVVPLDDTRQWYRFHALFREFLLGEFRRRRPTAELVALQVRAAEWCDAKGMPDQAVEYLLRTEEHTLLGPLLMRTIRPAYLDGRIETIDRWLDTANASVIEHHPPLAILAGWFAALTGRATDAVRWADRVEGLAFDGVTDDGWSSFTSATAAFRALLCAEGVEAMHRDAELVVELEPVWSPWRNTAVWLLGQARELVGDVDGATAAYDEVLALDAEGTHPSILVAPVARALLAMDAQDWSAAETYLHQAMQRAEVLRPADYLAGVLAHAACARLALAQGDTDRLDGYLETAMASRHLGTYAVPYVAVRIRLLLADVHVALGSRVAARELMDEVDQIAAKRPDLGTLLTAITRAQERVDSPTMGDVGLTPAELRVLPYLRTHLTFAQIGEQLFISRNTVHTHVGSIYRKLAVSSRSEAVDRSRELGLAVQ